ncbi:C4-dicarboxylic acid transporter DauA [Marinobacteraceae bacterium S3BR75-40.1]
MTEHQQSDQLRFAFLDVLRQGYSRQQFRGDLMAGITVGIVAVPLCMALAIASGVPPQHGLYTSIITGVVIALFGGSRINISGPTAAFVVLLLPIVHEYGVGGLMIATMMAGLILLVMGLARMGRLIQYIPYPVFTGFTAGIGVVIATLQIKDFLGLTVTGTSDHFIEKAALVFQAVPTVQWNDALIGIVTLAILIGWNRLKTAVPGHLVALIAGSLLALVLQATVPGFDVATIGSKFQYTIDGQTGQGIPAVAPTFALPWHWLGEDQTLSWSLIQALIGPAFAIAMLGAIESLLCAVVADGLAGMRHNPNGELVGQGLGNLIAPLFGGITATAAIARTATNVRSGGTTPVASLIHAGVVLLAVIALADYMSAIPMASLAALLLVVAWNMSEAKHFVHIVKVAPRSDVAVLLTCFSLTVLMDMVVAVGVGVVMAALLFMRRMVELTEVELIGSEEHAALEGLPPHTVAYGISGPMFFGAAEKAISVLHRYRKDVKNVIIDMQDVPMMDMTALVAFETALDTLRADGKRIILCRAVPRLVSKLQRAGVEEVPGKLDYCDTLECARRKLAE